jgi:DNA-binding MarR family transcriptional regulator
MAAIGENATPAEISRWLLREPHSVSGILERMEKNGLIKRVKDLERRNMIRVTFTEKGKQAYGVVRRRGVWHKIMEVLTAEEQEYLAYLLNKVHEKVLKLSGIKKPPSPYPG